jgi:hypothetical protein
VSMLVSDPEKKAVKQARAPLPLLAHRDNCSASRVGC